MVIKQKNKLEVLEEKREDSQAFRDAIQSTKRMWVLQVVERLQHRLHNSYPKCNHKCLTIN
jgi:hypothetical protein